MRKNYLKFLSVMGAAALGIALAAPAGAQDLLAKARAGETIRIGFANEVPWAYPGEGNKPLGFVNALALGVLKEMGITKIEPVVTEWGGLIPGLQANRFDIITGGMYILNSRCQNVNFSEPVGVFGDAFIVAKGNPKSIQTYQDIKNKNAVVVTGAGFNIVEVAKKEGIAENNIMQVPGPTEILAAVKAGRADAGGVTFFTAQNLAKQSGGAVDVTDPSKLPEWTLNWVGIAFRKSDTAFLDAFNQAQKKYLGSSEMLASVAEYGYTKAQLPGKVTTEYACANR
ncbi:MAG: ectoine/hydroxyectoine ABC transporter substrate-binding protein EhuB [Gammaproteobacteria bacterium]|nr:ectoine/hydroxyectoine ABC transporter substrate-binding protein EhuB [Gammaproteobacteria bacterium]